MLIIIKFNSQNLYYNLTQHNNILMSNHNFTHSQIHNLKKKTHTVLILSEPINNDNLKF